MSGINIGMKKKPGLLIPVENQVRELDAKLLLACIAAGRGLTSIVGSKREIEERIGSFPKSIYLAKSLLPGHRKFFKIAKKLGHLITAWDEDALVHLPNDVYYSRRLSEASLACVSHLFAWGEDNAELWRQYPHLPKNMPIHVTGNPRNDLLRSEIRAYYGEDVKKIKERFGSFILINTNFNHVNAFSPIRRLFMPPEKPGERPKFGRAARGMTREYAEGLRTHKQALFERFKEMIPALGLTFPEETILIRPHPVEGQDDYKKIAAKCKNVVVCNQGNVVPWLMACKAVVLNGCTTSVEAYAMGVPCISYRINVDDNYDLGFYRLPNTLSHQCFDFDELEERLRQILDGRIGIVNNDEAHRVIAQHLTAYEGPLACERIIRVLEKEVSNLDRYPQPPIKERLDGWLKARKRRKRRLAKLQKADATKSIAHHRKKNPEISSNEIRVRIEKFRKVLGKEKNIRVNKIHRLIFKISA